MLLLEPNETPYDLRFNLFGIPVRVHPLFWLVAALLGWRAIDHGFEYVLAWIMCMFLSILIHELGHVWMGIVFGTRGQIVLYSFGGLTIGSNALGTWWQRIAVSFAGPMAGFLFLGLVVLVTYLMKPEDLEIYLVSFKYIFDWPFGLNERDAALFAEVRRVVLHPTIQDSVFFDLFFLNLFWGLLNLLPIWPLDGGQISRELFSRFIPGNGLRISLVISVVVAGLFAFNSLMAHYGQRLVPYLPTGGIFMAVMFGLLAIQSLQMLQQTSYHDPHDPWMGQGRPWDRRR